MEHIQNCISKTDRPENEQFEHYLDRDYNLFEDNKIQHVDKNQTFLGKKRLWQKSEALQRDKFKLEKIKSSESKSQLAKVDQEQPYSTVEAKAQENCPH